MTKSKKNSISNKYLEESSAIIIQKRWHVLLKFKKRVDTEVRFFRNTLKNIISRINDSHKQSMISMNEYKKLMNQINTNGLKMTMKKRKMFLCIMNILINYQMKIIV